MLGFKTILGKSNRINREIFLFTRLLNRALNNASIDIERIRNVGIVAHIDAGKTTTTEQMLYLAGQTTHVGRVDSGDTVMDFLPQERERGITIASAAISFQWKDHHVNLIDTPGHVDFTIEVERCVRVLDAAVLIVDAVAGVQAQTRTVWRQACKQQIPAIAFINKMDRAGADFNQASNSLREKLGIIPVPVQLPIGSEETFRGVLDLISMQRVEWDSSSSSSRAPCVPIISDITVEDPQIRAVLTARKEMIESLAEVDEQFMDRFLKVSEEREEEEGRGERNRERERERERKDDGYVLDDGFSERELVEVLRRVCAQCVAVPLLCGASLRGQGVEPLLNAVCAFLPSPVDRPSSTAVLTEKTGVTHPAKREVAPSSRDLCALAFKVDCHPNRGLMVYIRTFSGTLHSKQTLFNSSNQCRERPTHVYRINGSDLVPVDRVGAGDVVCLLGLKNTVTGNTLVLEKGPLCAYELEGLTVPLAVFALAVEPEKSSQQPQLEAALQTLCLEDPSLRVELDPESGQTLLRGIGELHLEIVCDKLRRRFNIEVETGRAYVAYRESLCESFEVSSLTHSYDRTLGNRRMFSGISVSVSCMDPTCSCEVVIEKTAKEGLSGEEMSALRCGLEDALTRGPKGFPVVGLRITVHSVTKDSDTTSGAIRACCASFVDHLLRGEGHILLEPIMAVEVDSPVHNVGDVLSDLTMTRKALVRDVLTVGSRNLILAEAPLAAMLGYATAIRSMTQGDASFSMEYLKHEVTDVPPI